MTHSSDTKLKPQECLQLQNVQDIYFPMSLTGLVSNSIKYFKNEIKSLTLPLLPEKQAKYFLFWVDCSCPLFPFFGGKDCCWSSVKRESEARFFVAVPSYIILFNYEAGMDSPWRHSRSDKGHLFLLRLLLTKNNIALSLSYNFVLLSNRFPYKNDQRKDVSRPEEAKDIPKSQNFHLILS